MRYLLFILNVCLDWIFIMVSGFSFLVRAWISRCAVNDPALQKQGIEADAREITILNLGNIHSFQLQ